MAQQNNFNFNVNSIGNTLQSKLTHEQEFLTQLGAVRTRLKDIGTALKTDILKDIKNNMTLIQDFDYKIDTITNIENKKYNAGNEGSKKTLSMYISEQFKQSDDKKLSYLNIIDKLDKNIASLTEFQTDIVELFGNNTTGSNDKSINNILDVIEANMPGNIKNAYKQNTNSVSLINTIKKLKSDINLVITQFLTKINTNKAVFKRKFKEYLLGLKTAIYNKIQEYYNKVSVTKLSIVTEEIAKFNQQSTSKNILNIINTTIINELLELLGWSKTINDVLQKNKDSNIYNGINGNKNFDSISTLADTISASIKSKYSTNSKQKVSDFKEKYSAKVASEIDTLVNTVADLKSQLLELVTKVTTSETLALNSLGNPYVINGIPVLDNVTETIGQIMPVKQDIMNKLADIISEIQTRLEIPAEGAVEGVVVPGSVPANTNAKLSNQLKANYGRSIPSMNRFSTGNSSASSQSYKSPVKETANGSMGARGSNSLFNATQQLPVAQVQRANNGAMESNNLKVIAQELQNMGNRNNLNLNTKKKYNALVKRQSNLLE